MVKTIDSSASEGGVCKGAVCGAPGTTNDTGYADRHEPMTFENTPFPETEQSIFRSIRRRPLWRYIYVAALVAVDVLVMLLSLVICFAFNPGAYDTVTRAMPIWAFLLAYCVIGLLCLAFAGAYHRHVMAEGYELYTKLINAAIFTIVLASCVAFMLNLQLPRTALIIAPLVGLVCELVARWMMRCLLHHHRRRGECKYTTVIVGSSEGINRTLRLMRRNSALGYMPVAVCPIAPDPRMDDAYVVTNFVADPDIEGADKLRVLSFGSRFARTIERMGVQEVYIADVLSRDSKLLHAMSLAIESLGIELAISVSLADVGGHRLHLRNSAEQQVLIASLPQYRTTTYVIKRIIDIVLSAVALVISSPIMLGVAIAIKLDDGGPVLFKQTRVGIHGKPFTMYKFRSMVTNAEEIKAKLAAESGQTDRFIFKLKDDPRITKVGKFIRKTSLDEFPQFFNVFKGDMSLVGPRPALPDEVARYGSLYSTRLLVKPGITGPWQVSGRSDLSQEQSEFLDVSYIENWSITGDLAILAKTVMVVFRGTGSY
ncbi:exopolysaccharide biosynthesis polyprenyl glycosylphosphotransferase [Bifidobacterium pullorum subsp. saeculare DSM 6531 = LMG 14934]|uniref:Exopolysaccharide biosynthesis polyprenyl glycosylphosphotransferase n=2 Tax=Bifidobacterium pullorum TaxID=78448 RepID=A0A087CP36_9BIFI|nr:exopolysaccharide biosynthesis polyprenyl glycosylphosphotransferase [Bifidobacterium pullorum subsp. saeculare DSM 6531 = LMG 14934]